MYVHIQFELIIEIHYEVYFKIYIHLNSIK